MSVKVMSHIFENCQLKPAAKLLLLAIADNANDDGFAFPGLERLVTKTCMARRSVINYLHWLEEEGYLVIVRTPGRGNQYNIPLPWNNAHPCKSCTRANPAPVQTVAPVPVQTVAPVPVQTVAPESSLEPPIESSEKSTRARKPKASVAKVEPHWIIQEWQRGCGDFPPMPTQKQLAQMNIDAQALADTLRPLPGEVEEFARRRLKKDGRNIPWPFLMADIGNWLRKHRARNTTTTDTPIPRYPTLNEIDPDAEMNKYYHDPADDASDGKVLSLPGVPFTGLPSASNE